EGHQHLHADPRDGDGAVTVPGPAGGQTQPAAGFVVGRTEAVPEKLHLNPTVLIAVDFLTGRAGDHRALAAEDAWFRVLVRRTKWRRPRGGAEAVAITLVEAAPLESRAGFSVAGH